MKLRKVVSLLAAVAMVFGLLPVTVSAQPVSSADYTAEELDSSRYEVEKYATPFWEGNIVYNECIYPIKNEDGSITPYDLMYQADEIVSVRNYGLGTVYEEGKDYRLTEDGKLEILPTGRIRFIEYDYMHPSSNPEGKPVDVYYPRDDGKGYEYWNEGPEFSNKTICVTYIHNDTWDYAKPENLEKTLPKTMSKLVHREPMTVVIAGDSITWGAKGSGCLNIAPYADAYPEMTIKAFGEKFGCNDITFYNSNTGGACSDYTEEKLERTIIQYDPDFVVLCFGMNDASSEMSTAEYARNMEGQVAYIKDKLPDCEILLLTSPYGNPYTFSMSLYEAHAKKLHEIAARWDGVGVSDAQKIEKDLMQKKDFLDFMGDNMVHPNDFGMRLLSQSIVSGFSVSDIAAYRETVMRDMEAKVFPPDYKDDGYTEQRRTVLDMARERIATLDSEWKITEVIDDAYAELRRLTSCTEYTFEVNETTSPDGNAMYDVGFGSLESMVGGVQNWEATVDILSYTPLSKAEGDRSGFGFEFTDTSYGFMDFGYFHKASALGATLGGYQAYGVDTYFSDLKVPFIWTDGVPEGTTVNFGIRKVGNTVSLLWMGEVIKSSTDEKYAALNLSNLQFGCTDSYLKIDNLVVKNLDTQRNLTEINFSEKNISKLFYPQPVDGKIPLSHWGGEHGRVEAKHSFGEATCTSPATCTVCGAVVGEALGHEFTVPATCTDPVTCARCGEEDPKSSALGHQYLDCVCTVCGEKEPILVGDIDGDGIVYLGDSILLKRYLAGWDVADQVKNENLKLVGISGDADQDGEVNVKDTILISRYLARWEIGSAINTYVIPPDSVLS